MTSGVVEDAEWRAAVERHRWMEEVDEPPYWDSCTVSVRRGPGGEPGAGVAQLVRAFGGDPSGPSQPMTYEQALDAEAAHFGEPREYALLLAGTVDGCAVGLEVGYRGSIPEIARRGSAGGADFLSAYCSVNARYQVMRAVNGQVEGVFDPFEWEDPATVAEHAACGEELPPWARGVTFHWTRLWADSLALLERTMRVTLERAFLEGPLQAYELRPISDLFQDTDAAWKP